MIATESGYFLVRHICQIPQQRLATFVGLDDPANGTEPVYALAGRPAAAYFVVWVAGFPGAGLEVGGESGGALDDAVDE